MVSIYEGGKHDDTAYEAAKLRLQLGLVLLSLVHLIPKLAFDISRGLGGLGMREVIHEDGTEQQCTKVKRRRLRTTMSIH